MSFIDEVLQQPTYGWKNEKGELIKPTLKQLYREAFSRINIFSTKKNWISLMSWVMTLCLLPFFFLFIFHFFSFKLLIVFIVYSMIVLSTHGTVWFHRFCTHKAYTFSHSVWRFIVQNLVVKTFPEEMYVVSHHVHHVKSDEPGDPYNPQAGIMYCILAEVNHQSISKNLTEAYYDKAARFMNNSGVVINSYRQYLKWGSIASPFYTVALWLGNWAFWYTIFYLIGGNAFACTLFSATLFWTIFVRAFNYTGHGNGKVKHIDGIDFDRSNLSINQTRPGLFSGEWHNNHHLFPVSARAGFLPYQIDLAWIFIFSMYKIGVVSSYHDSKKEFLRKYRNRKLI
ncbi:MAG TPA: fatty acid desaturase [Puia sp.]|jgi:fatty-acid desaturase|nr:fatty acid desaturase [Puia sp.]